MAKSRMTYIIKRENCVWPYGINEKLLQGITPSEWKRAVREFTRFVDEGGELRVCDSKLLLKTHGVYAFAYGVLDERRVRNRNEIPYEVVSENYPYDDSECERVQHKLPVKSVHNSAAQVGRALRQQYQLGYETRILDTWNNRRTVARKDGFPTLW